MQRLIVLLSALIILVFLNSCVKRNIPSKTAPAITYDYDSSSVKESPVNAEVVVKKPVAKKTPSPPLPRLITVNDAAAKKSVDGRLYYDVQGKRYWKNYKDGKYHLFNKNMYNNPDFKPPSK